MNKFATRKRNVFDPLSKSPFELSRSKIELFIKCPRCFYLDRRLGVAPPRSFPFNLNEAVDILLKKEFDIYREKQQQHPIMKGTDFIPFKHEDLEEWRNAFKGIRYHHKDSNFIVFGGVDDVWINEKEELSVVDYKSTSKDAEINLDAEWQNSYKRQVEIYQWIFNKNGFKVSPKTFFVYANGDRTEETFNDILKFNTKLIEYIGDYAWVDDVLQKIRLLLSSEEIPKEDVNCELCKYRTVSGKSFKEHLKNSDK